MSTLRTQSKTPPPRDLESEWTREQVVHRLREAWDTLRRLPGRVLPPPLSGYWPDVVLDWREAYGYTAERTRLARPSPRAIDRMHETIGWLNFIALQRAPKDTPPDLHERTCRLQSRALWFTHASGLGPKRAGDIMGLHRDTVRRLRDEGLAVIVTSLRATEAAHCTSRA